jgi:serine/threonine protein kinase/formylglycine-generating enzyme required for sulfatase activity
MPEPDPALLRTVIGRALELPPGQRAEFAARECGSNQDLHAAVQRLLAKAGAAAPDFLEPPDRSAPTPDHTVLGEFELLRELGRGGMGVVYLARQGSLGREVAVKVFIESLTTTQREIDRFHREARAVASLAHPGIVRVLTDGKTGNAHWFAMEFVDGHDLRRELELQNEPASGASARLILPAPGSPERMASVARICAEVADALHHAHQAGLVHRDVKPANLLLTRSGRAMVGDFGLVRDESLTVLTRTGEAPGTPHYMSPEQATGGPSRLDQRTDIYSLGVVLYELAGLCRPFDGNSSDEILSQIRTRDPKPLRSIAPDVARDLELICATAMAKDPGHRYRDAAAFADDLRRFLRHEAILARPPSWPERCRRWARTHSRSVAAGAFLSLGLGLGGAAAVYWAHDRGLARVSLAVMTSDGQALRGSVRVVEIEPIAGVASDPEWLGRLALEGERVPPGWNRFLIELESAHTLELERQLEEGTAADLKLVVRSDLPDDEGMVRIEGGRLSLRDADAPLSSLNDRDILVETFWLDACEVSNGEYRRFLEDTGHAPPKHWEAIDPTLHDTLPVVWVSWQDARDFAEWNGKRLPTYSEWMWAARGSEGRLYPWPDAVKGEWRGNIQHKTTPTDTASYLRCAAPVDSSPEARTESGLYNLFGNVAEWTGSPFAEPTQGRFTARPFQRFIAGFAWDAAERGYTLQSIEFDGIERSYANARRGFRCARSFLPPPTPTRSENLGDHQEAGRSSERGQRSGPARHPR